LGEIARIASTAKIAKNKTENFSDELNEKPKKVLAFVVYSCYKMISPPHWRASFWATCNPAVLKSFVFLQVLVIGRAVCFLNTLLLPFLGLLFRPFFQKPWGFETRGEVSFLRG
jgi:hypothetical protein